MMGGAGWPRRFSALIDLDALACLDGLLWLRTGEEVGRRLGLSQSTISRHSRRALELFGMELIKRDGEWDLRGEDPILAAERQVHQQARWLGHRPLRLEATYWSGPLLASPVPAGWVLGLSNIVGVPRNLELLRQRIVDVWIAGLPDVPPQDDPDFLSLPLSRMPLHCVVQDGHPLLQRPDLRFEDLAPYPSLALPSGAYPLVEEALKQVGLWSNPVRMQRYDRRLWEGRTEEDLTIGYATRLSLAVTGGGMAVLPLQLPIETGDALVVRRDFATAAPLRALLTTLQQRVEALARHQPELVPVATELSGSSETAGEPPRPGP
jgi:DNA-binding transcriptional LysR family regulator